MVINVVGKSVWVKLSTITDPPTLAYVKRVGRIRPRGWVRLDWSQWTRRPGVRKPELKAKE